MQFGHQLRRLYVQREGEPLDRLQASRSAAAFDEADMRHVQARCGRQLLLRKPAPSSELTDLHAKISLKTRRHVSIAERPLNDVRSP